MYIYLSIKGVNVIIHDTHYFHLFTLNSTNASCQLHILGHDGNSLSVNGTQIGIIEQIHQMRFRRRLQCQNGRSLPSKGRFILRHLNFSYQTRKREPAQQQVGGILVRPNLLQRLFAYRIIIEGKNSCQEIQYFNFRIP